MSLIVRLVISFALALCAIGVCAAVIAMSTLAVNAIINRPMVGYVALFAFLFICLWAFLFFNFVVRKTEDK